MGASSKKEKTTAPAKTKEAVKEPVMYAGPTVSRYGLIQNTVYTDIPEGGKKLFEAVPIASLLLINVAEYPAVEESIRTQTGQYWAAYKAVIDNTKKGVI